MSLEAELQTYRRQLATDAYPMSIGELSNLYRDEELDIHPEFQRIFRWTPVQKTRLIESILLGIPLPSIFVAQNEDGIWDVVDGVQRLSTIFQFMGILKNEEGQYVEPLRCVEAPFLKSMEGLTYEAREGATDSLDSAQRLDFKRARIDVKIIKRESDARAKYDLFQRLNSYGSPATAQELRDCLLVSLSKRHFEWLSETAEIPEFLDAIELPERLIDESYHHELALRFVVLRQLPDEELPRIGNIGEYLTNSVLGFVERNDESLRKEREVFQATFRLLSEGVGSGVLRKWRTSTDSTTGAFSLTAFETLALGIGFYNAAPRIDAVTVREKRIELWSDKAYQAGFATGMRADTRMRQTIPTGRVLFAQHASSA